MAEQIQQGIAIITPTSSRIVYINPFFCEILGITDTDKLKEADAPLWRYVHTKDIDALESTRKQWLKSSCVTASCEINILRPDNSSCWAIISGTPTEFDGLPAILITLVDITERIQTEKQRRNFEADLHHTQKLESLGVLAGGVAHDFNNILATIAGRCDLAHLQLADDSVAYEHFAEIRSAADRAAELCRSLLAYAGNEQIESKPINIDELIDETLPLLKLSISTKTNLLYRTDNERLSVTGDRSQLRQVILNLILNAAESLKDRTGQITMRIREKQFRKNESIRFYNGQRIMEGKYVLLEVSDSGAGMEPTVLERLFEPFFTTKFTGRGLGLAAVLGIIRSHGGDIQVTSTPGKGSCFTIYLPADQDSDNVSEAFNKHPVTGWGNGLILIAEDNQQVQRLTSGMVEALGFNVLCASDGIQAVEVFEKNADIIQAVILDVVMPAMDGREVFANIRSRKGALPVLFVSGFDAANVHKELNREPHVAFLQKPFSLESLSASMKKLVAGEVSG